MKVDLTLKEMEKLEFTSGVITEIWSDRFSFACEMMKGRVIWKL